VLDLVFAALYGLLGFVVVPSRSRLFDVALAIVCALLAAAGIGLVARAKWGRPLAIGASALVLAFASVLLVGLVASSAYLHGVYGSLGRGLSILSLVIAALVIQFFVLLPLFQLRFLLQKP
jgi:hypothetical protein